MTTKKVYPPKDVRIKAVFKPNFVIEEDGSESEEIAKITTVIDINYDTERLCSMNETWICSNIYQL